MNEILSDFSPMTLIQAIEDNFIECWTNFSLGGEFYRDDEIIRIASVIPDIPYNGVFYTNWQDADIDAKIQTHIKHFKSRNAQIIWAINPSTQPPDLAEHLLTHGFNLAENLVGMATDLTKLPDQIDLPPETEIRNVEDLHSLRHFVELVAWKWHLPPESNELYFNMN